MDETNYQGRHGRRDDITKKVCVDVPDFFGRMDVKVFTDCITALEDYFEWYNMEEDKRVSFVKMKMKGAARVWWRGIDDKNANYGRRPIKYQHMGGDETET